MKMLIKITKEVITEAMYCPVARAGTLYNCAVAVAVREIFPGARVELFDLYPFGQRGTPSIPLPTKASCFIINFDGKCAEQRLLMNPVSFEIDVPNEFIESIGLQELETILSKSVNLELVDRH